jgi:hypothetical protein
MRHIAGGFWVWCVRGVARVGRVVCGRALSLSLLLLLSFLSLSSRTGSLAELAFRSAFLLLVAITLELVCLVALTPLPCCTRLGSLAMLGVEWIWHVEYVLNSSLCLLPRVVLK